MDNPLIEPQDEMPQDVDASAMDTTSVEEPVRTSKRASISWTVLIVASAVIAGSIVAIGLLISLLGGRHNEVLGAEVLKLSLVAGASVVALLICTAICSAFVNLLRVMALESVAYVVARALQRPMQFALWGLANLMVMPLLFTEDYEQELKFEWRKGATIFIVCTALFIAKNMLFLLYSATFRAGMFADQLKSLVFEEHLIERLAQGPEPGAGIQVNSNSTFGRRVTGLFSWLNFSNLLSPSSSRIDLSKQHGSQIAAQIMRLWNATIIDRSIVERVCDERHVDVALRALDVNGDGAINEFDLSVAIQRLVHRRQSLTNTYSVHNAFGSVVNQVVDVVFLLGLFILVLALYGISVSAVLVALGTFVVATSFAFGTTIQGILASLLLIFHTRAFQVGDRISIGESDFMYIVSRVGIVTTRLDGEDGRKFYLPTSTLASSKLINLTRTRIVRIQLDVAVESESVSHDVLSSLRNDMEAFFSSHPEVYMRNRRRTFLVNETDANLIVRVVAFVRASWANKPVWQAAQSDMLITVRSACDKLGLDRCPIKIDVAGMADSAFAKPAKPRLVQT